MKESRFVSPPGALKTSSKKVLVTEESMKEGEERFQRMCKSMNLTPIDDVTLELIRARKKSQSHNPATAQH